MKYENSLAAKFPKLAAEWHPTKNGELAPDMVAAGSHKKVWWLGKCGHEWQASVADRCRGRGCPVCAGRQVLTGYNDLVTTSLELAAEWHPTKNGELTPEMVTSGSNKKVWWQCSKGHEWQAPINSRSFGGNGCPYCAGQKAWAGFNDLQFKNPSLAAEWHPTKNGTLSPEMVTVRSGKKVWWLGKCGHEWQAVIANRSKGVGCPYCFGVKAIPGETDLATTHPELAKEWHPTKNGGLTPHTVSYGSFKKVWWQCDKGHEWLSLISNRSKGNGCPECAKESHTSFPEQAILYYLKKVAVADSRNIEFGKEIDVYLPEYRIGIEYNGAYYHKIKELADAQKVSFFAKKNIRIISINESVQNQIKGDIIEYIYSASDKSSLEWAITALFDVLGLTVPSIDILEDTPKIYDQYVCIEKANSVAALNPTLAAEWHPTKNGKVTPEKVMLRSNKSVWWQCSKGHEWQAVIASRAEGKGCPCCSGRKAIPGETDLATQNPTLAAEWHPTKNGELKPEEVTSMSHNKVWWQCSKGHEWQAVIERRSKGSGCPYCAGQKAWAGFNDLQFKNPSLAAEWHPTKNGNLTPDMVTPGSGKKVWWLGKCGHEWQAQIAYRSAGSKCPYCARRKAIPGETDLATQNPSLAAEWHPTKNGTLSPEMVTLGSHKKVWWMCHKGHEWESIISNRSQGNGCPECARERKQRR